MVKFKDIAQELFVMVPNVCGLARATRALILPKSKVQASTRTAYALVDQKGEELTLDFEAVWLHGRQRPVPMRQFTEFLAEYRRDEEVLRSS